METPVTIWHYLSTPFVLAAVGVVWHFARGFWAPYPERLVGGDLPTLGDQAANLSAGTGYRWTDIVHEVEFDEDGYYRWDSWRNLRIAVGLVVLPGTFLVVFVPEIASLYASCINAVLDWSWRLAVYRWHQNFG